MKRILLLLSVITLSSSAFCTELVYNWKAGGTYYFEATAVDDISMSMGSMSFGESNMKMKYTTNTKFVLLIESVDANGTADGAVYLQQFTVKNEAGKLMASLADIPKSAIFTDVRVDRKGNFTFMKEIYMMMTETSNILVSGDAPTEDDAGGMDFDMSETGVINVNAYAEFNPTTGAMKPGYSMKTISQTKVVPVKVEADDAKFDIIPYSFLELMVMPDGDLNTGDKVDMAVATQKVAFSVLSMANGLASIQTDLSTDKNASLTESSMNATSPANGSQMNMNTDENGFDFDMDTEEMDMDFDTDDMDTDMDDMDMDDMDMDLDAMGMDMDMMGMDMFGNSTSVTDMMPTMTGTINGTFNYVKGMFSTVTGFVTTSIDMMGMKLNAKTTLSMKLL